MTYIQRLNSQIKKTLAEHPDTVVFGQNVGTGSCLSGLTRGIEHETGVTVLNTPNAENTLVGVGFGMMMGGVNSIYFMKQIDFLLLGLDHLVNTYNFVRLKNPEASFTIVPVIVDNGYQGLQSSFNSFGDICSIARIDGFTVTNGYDIDKIIGQKLVAPGFRIIAPSQRLFGSELYDPESVTGHGPDYEWFHYQSGNDVLVICFNYTLPQGLSLVETMESKGLSASLAGVNRQTPAGWGALIDEARRVRKVIILDDTKSVNRLSNDFLASLYVVDNNVSVLNIGRDFNTDWLKPQKDELEIDADAILKYIGTVFTEKYL